MKHSDSGSEPNVFDSESDRPTREVQDSKVVMKQKSFYKKKENRLHGIDSPSKAQDISFPE